VAPTRAEEGAGTLTTDRWQQLESLCHAALARPADALDKAHRQGIIHRDLKR
jgi:serine/threonine protein kinase